MSNHVTYLEFTKKFKPIKPKLPYVCHQKPNSQLCTGYVLYHDLSYRGFKFESSCHEFVYGILSTTQNHSERNLQGMIERYKKENLSAKIFNPNELTFEKFKDFISDTPATAVFSLKIDEPKSEIITSTSDGHVVLVINAENIRTGTNFYVIDSLEESSGYGIISQDIVKQILANNNVVCVHSDSSILDSLYPQVENST